MPHRFHCAFLAAAVAAILAAASGAAPDALAAREQAEHVLNRLGFGPRPGDINRVLAAGIPAYLAAQLHPESIPDAKADAAVSRLETLSLSNTDLFARFVLPLAQARRALKAEKAALQKDGAGDATDSDPQALRKRIAPENRPRRVLAELTAARILRATESERQLNEVLVDFWMNRFNVYANKGIDRVAIVSFERDTIRPHIWGRFEDLLMATAASPAMLFYLDNARSVAEPAHRPVLPARAATRTNPGGPTGPNENYARELMELHTLGVDGGYTQKDVTELARILTGWSIALPRAGGRQAFARRNPEETVAPGSFVFRARLHDVGSKTFLGRVFPMGGGIEEGERALQLLAHHPATANRVAFRFCQRLVADEPPPALVARVAQRFLSTDGDLRETVRAVLESPEFLDSRFYRVKIKSPFEYAVSAIRALGGSTDGLAVARRIAEMGEPLYLCQPPTGYPETGNAWIDSGGLIARMNFAMALAEGRLPGTAANVDASTLAAGLALGGPEFQRR